MAHGEFRNDALVKLDLFDKHIRHRYRVEYVLDDRDRVVNAWRSIGLTVFQVAEGSF
ncbi:phosphatase domain-containing protein [Hamadaea tsunoensis]